jgi:hypothetical protein
MSCFLVLIAVHLSNVMGSAFRFPAGLELQTLLWLVSFDSFHGLPQQECQV